MTVQRLRAALAGRTRLTSSAWAVAWLVPLVAQAGRSAGWAGPLAALATAAPLAGRHRWPLHAFGAVGVLAGLSWALLDGEPYFPVALVLLAVHAVALRQRGPRLTWTLVAAATLFTALVVAASIERGGGPAMSAVTSPFVLGSLLTAAALLGVNTRVRREHLVWLEERAQRLETERDQRARMAVVAERAQIARELHDIVAHSLTVIVRLADGVAAQAARTPGRPPDPAALSAVSGTGRQALTEMRRLLDVLGEDGEEPSAESRAPQPGPEQLDALVAHVRAAGVSVALTRQGDSRGWSAGTSLAVHRIVQEALTNVLEHAGPGARAEVSLRTTSRGVEVVVEDDGRGALATPPADGRGRGLTGMRERAASYGGVLDAGPRPDTGGWRVRAELDVDQVAPAPSKAPSAGLSRSLRTVGDAR